MLLVVVLCFAPLYIFQLNNFNLPSVAAFATLLARSLSPSFCPWGHKLYAKLQQAAATTTTTNIVAAFDFRFPSHEFPFFLSCVCVCVCGFGFFGVYNFCFCFFFLPLSLLLFLHASIVFACACIFALFLLHAMSVLPSYLPLPFRQCKTQLSSPLLSLVSFVFMCLFSIFSSASFIFPSFFSVLSYFYATEKFSRYFRGNLS